MRFSVSCGDIGGIGPEIIVKALNVLMKNKKNYSFIINIPSEVFSYYYNLNRFDFPFTVIRTPQEIKKNTRCIVIIDDFNFSFNSTLLGKETREGGEIAYRSILSSFNLCKSAQCDAMITAPISKVSLRLADKKYPGHTELLAKLDKASMYSMFFLSENFIANLFTIHQPIAKVPGFVTKPRLRKFFEHSLKTLKNDFNIPAPRIAVLGLNPHAGENGLIGEEEIKFITPVIREFKDNFFGPFVPDAFFAKSIYGRFDLVIGMYHDQVLIPFKMMNFNSGVNYTAGLKIIRTSPDHGTGFDIAGKNSADPSSIISAFMWAERIKKSRQRSVEIR